MADWNVQRLRRPQIKVAAAALASAFADDPLAHYMQPDDEKRTSFNAWSFEKTLNYGLLYGEPWTDTEVNGAAVWLPPDKANMSLWRSFRAGFATLPFRAGLAGMSRFRHLDRVLRELRKQAAPKSYWYLMVLGVAPETRGTGLGTALIRVGTERADDDGVPCYLETETPENVEYYERRGFVVTAEADVAPGFTMWGMRREPQ